jgi:hypothetical protein
MPLIWLSALCMAIIMVLLVLGERSLPLFGGDRVLAARAYKTLFMLLITGLMTGLFPALFRFFAAIARARAKATDAYPEMLRFAVTFFETTGPWFAAIVGLGGLVLTAYIWITQ